MPHLNLPCQNSNNIVSGSLIIKSPNDAEYTNIWSGYPNDYVATEVPPRYFWPLSSSTIAQSYGKITNGYGFAP